MQQGSPPSPCSSLSCSCSPPPSASASPRPPPGFHSPTAHERGTRTRTRTRTPIQIARECTAAGKEVTPTAPPVVSIASPHTNKRWRLSRCEWSARCTCSRAVLGGHREQGAQLSARAAHRRLIRGVALLVLHGHRSVRLFVLVRHLPPRAAQLLAQVAE